MVVVESVSSPVLVTRLTTPPEYRAAADSLCASYLREPPTDERWVKSLPSWENMISYTTWDADHCVGHAGYHVTETTVPGGARVGSAAVTRVGVLPTHSRLGAGTALMDAVIEDAVGRKLPLASLRASESLIYRRYGFGIAGDFADAAIDPARVGSVTGAAPGRFRLLPGAEIEAATADIDNRALTNRPGLMTRPDPWRRWHFSDAIEQTKGAFVAVHLDGDGLPDGYVYYNTSWNDIFDGGGSGEVNDVMAVTPAVELALWAYLFDVDLVRSWVAVQRPLDDLVRDALDDRRAYKVTAINDEQWLRLINVDEALSSRTYSSVTDSIVVEVSDPKIVDNNGRWRISGDGARRCDDDKPDIEAGIDAISALYLGAGSWRTEVALGRARTTRNNADQTAVLTLADQLFSHKPLPFCGTFF